MSDTLDYKDALVALHRKASEDLLSRIDKMTSSSLKKIIKAFTLYPMIYLTKEEEKEINNKILLIKRIQYELDLLISEEENKKQEEKKENDK